jgi:hypothetical protein
VGISSDVQATRVCVCLYGFHNLPCTKLTGPGIALHMTEQHQTQHEVSKLVLSGSQAIFKGSGVNDQGLWLGRAVSKLDS